MKTVVNNLVWMVLFSIMVCASIYPQVSGVSQSVIWLLNILILIVAPIVITGSCIEDDKEKLEKMAGKKSGVVKKTFGVIKFSAMFAAVAYAGFTVAAVFYAVGSFLILVSIFVARDRLEKMA